MNDGFSLYGKDATDGPIDRHWVLPILDAETLLEPKPRQLLLSKIRKLSKAPEQHYRALFLQLLHNIAEFLQCLPVLHRTPDQTDYCLLDSALMQGALALREMMRTTSFSHYTEQQRILWGYAVFSATLLHEIGRVVTDYQVSLCNEEQQVIDFWAPFAGSMRLRKGEQAISHYMVREIEGGTAFLRTHCNLLLARQLMPEDGFLWISNDPEIFSSWMTALTGGPDRQGGGIALILSLVHKLYEKAEAQIEDFAALMQRLRDRLGNKLFLLSKLRNAEAFLRWLKDIIRTERLVLNGKDSTAYLTPEGLLLLHPMLFQEFCKNSRSCPDWIVLFKEFNMLGLTRLSGDDKLFEKYFQHLNQTDKALGINPELTGEKQAADHGQRHVGSRLTQKQKKDQTRSKRPMTTAWNKKTQQQQNQSWRQRLAHNNAAIPQNRQGSHLQGVIIEKTHQRLFGALRIPQIFNKIKPVVTRGPQHQHLYPELRYHQPQSSNTPKPGNKPPES